MAYRYMKRGGHLISHDLTERRDATDYRAEKPVPSREPVQVYDAAEVTMTSPSWQNHFYDSDKYGMGYTVTGRRNKPEVGEQGALFSRQPGDIFSAFSAEGARTSVPTLLGIAANDHMQQWMDKDPQLPLPSDDLSEHSSAMVRKIMSKNPSVKAHPDNPKAEPTNDFDFDSGVAWNLRRNLSRLGADHVTKGRFETIPQEEVDAGFQTLKAVMRGQQFQGGV